MATVALLFPGQGSQSVGMGKDLYERYPVAKTTFAEANTALGFDLAQLCFEGPEESLTLTTNTQPAIVTTSIAALRVLQAEAALDIEAVAGHSLGEYSALVCAGALAFPDAVRTVRKRGAFMQAAVPVGVGAMAAIIGLERADVDAICEQVNRPDNIVTLANINSPGQYVISGHTNAVNEAITLAKEQGAKRAIPLSVSAPFHSPLMRPAAEKLAQVLATVTFNDLHIPLINNAEAAVFTSGAEARESLVRQMYKSVAWEHSIQEMLARGISTFIEVGPGKVLIGLLKRIDKTARGFNVCDIGTLKETMQSL